MKLKNFAALMVRLLGGLLVLAGASDLLISIVQYVMAAFGQRLQSELPLSEGIAFAVFGFCLMYFSTRLATLLCKGLEDDSG